MKEEKLIELIKLVYEEDLALHLKTRPVGSETAAKLAEAIGPYNRFDPEKVAEVIRRFRGRVEGWEIGREYSPVIYVHIPYWTHHREGSKETSGERINREEREKLKQELIEAFKEAHADEVDEISPSILRFWWD